MGDDPPNIQHTVGSIALSSQGDCRATFWDWFESR
jgi:hypothetical protein